MSEMEDLKRRLDKDEKVIEHLVDQQLKNSMVLKDIQNSITEIKVWIRGDAPAGVKGVVQEMKDFKSGFNYDYVKDQNMIFEKMKNLEEKENWNTARIKALEESEKLTSKKHGFIAGVSAVVASSLTYLLTILK